MRSNVLVPSLGGRRCVREAEFTGLHFEIGGPVVRAGERAPPGRAEAIGLAAASVILLIAFGSVVSMGVPVVTALFALGLVVRAGVRGRAG